MMSAENDTNGYSTFERSTPYFGLDKSRPYQASRAQSADHYYPVLSDPLQASQQYPSNYTAIHQQPLVACATVVSDKPNNYLVFSIINLLLFWWTCLPLIALIYSLRVNSEHAAGRLTEAIDASLMAWRYNRIGFILGIFITGAVIIAVVSLVLANHNQDEDDDYSR